MIKNKMYSLGAVLALVLACVAAWWFQNAPKAPASAPSGAAAPAKAPVVDARQVRLLTLSDDTQAVGSLRSRRGVVLRPEVSGRITQLHFQDGQSVRKGQLLVQLDDQLPLAQVQQSRAELSIALANHTRNKDLVAQNFISQRSLDESAAALEVAQAKLALAQATAARLKIVAPFSGMAGIRSANVGDYLKDGADIVNIEDLEAVFVDFRLPERYQAQVKAGQSASVVLDALPNQQFVALIQAVDPLIDANGRSVAVRGCIDNRALRLRPGMFARVTLVFGAREQAKVIPEEAIVPLGGQFFVIRLQPGATAQTRVSQRVEVKLGIRRPGQVEIVSGLEAGDTVVTAGQQRITRDGTEVKVLDVVPTTPAPANVPTAAASAPVVANAAPVAAHNPCLERNI